MLYKRANITVAAVKFSLKSQDFSRLVTSKLKLNSCLCRKPERKTSVKVSVFSSQVFCSFSLRLFSFSLPVCFCLQTSAVFTCVIVFSFSWFRTRLVTAAEHTMFPVTQLQNKALKWLNIVKKLK